MKKIGFLVLTYAALLTGCNEDHLPEASFNLFQVESMTVTAGDRTATVKWVLQEGKPEPLDYYITWEPDNTEVSGGEASVPAGQHELTIDELRNDCTYTFSVQAHYANGLSMKVATTATPKSTRIAATNFKAMAGDSRVYLSWMAPDTQLDYRYDLLVASTADQHIEVPKEATSYLVNGLTNGVEYAFTLTAVYAHGNSDSVTTSATPGEIDPISATPTSSESLAQLRQFELCRFEYNPAYFVMGEVKSVRWNFGDDHYSDETAPLHRFMSIGTYTVSITVNYADDSTETAELEIHVSGLEWSVVPNTGYQKASQVVFAPDGQTLYTVSQTDKRLIAVNAITGQLRWTYNTDGSTYGAGPAVGADGTVYFGTEDTNGTLYAVKANGETRWTQKLGSSVKAAPAVTSDGTVYALDNKGKLFALQAENGAEKWTAQQSGAAAGVVVDAAGTVYIATSTGLWAYSESGTMRWTSDKAYVVTERGGSLALHDGILYATLKSKGGCVAIDAATGTTLWQYATTANDCYHPAVDAEGTVYFCEKNGGLYAVRKDGTLKWHDTTQTNYIYSGFAIAADGTAYISQYAAPFNLLAFDPSGTRSVFTEIGAQTMSPVTIGPDSRLYYGKNGEISAIALPAPLADKGWPMRGGNWQGSNSLK